MPLFRKKESGAFWTRCLRDVASLPCLSGRLFALSGLAATSVGSWGALA